MSEMTYRRLGNSGLMVSTVGLGTNAFGARVDARQTQSVVDAALDAGITLFDTSDTYGVGASEELLGRSLGRRRRSPISAQAISACSFRCSARSTSTGLMPTRSTNG